jgi:hypothetical protein
MRNIAIIGAGQSGLQLGIGLRKLDFAVSIYTNRKAQDVLNGKILSNQAMFGTSLQYERALSLNFWDNVCPPNESITVTVADPIQPKENFYWQGRTRKIYQSVDQRLKFSRWMNEFEALGGNLHIQEIDIAALEKISKNYELIIIAGGKGKISQMFPLNWKRSYFDKPQRAVSCLYVQGVTPPMGLPGVRITLLPKIGEFLTMPGLTLNGSCEMLMFEGVKGGPFDCWGEINNSKQQLCQALKLLKKYIPCEAEYCKNVELTDNQASLVGSISPAVRHPTFRLPSGGLVFGMGDTLVLNDPLAGQGANNASKAANLYLKRIIEKEHAPFDEAWMHETFELYWQQCAKWSVEFTRIVLLPPPHIIHLFKLASKSSAFANKLANGFDDPSQLFPWIADYEEALTMIRSFQKEPEIHERVH